MPGLQEEVTNMLKQAELQGANEVLRDYEDLERALSLIAYEPQWVPSGFSSDSTNGI